MNQNHADNSNHHAIEEGQEFGQNSDELLLWVFVITTLTTLTLALPFVS